MSGEISGRELDVSAVTDASAAARSGVAHAELLVGFCDGLVARDEDRLAAAREALRQALGPEGFVDAAAVAGNFERMVRIADGCGISLDSPVELVSSALRRKLGVDRFASAANTPASGALRRVLGRLAAPLLLRVLLPLGRRSRRAGADRGAGGGRIR